MKRKVLILGIGQTNFLAPLYEAIKRIRKDHEFHIVGPRKLDKGIDWGESNAFDKIIAAESSRKVFLFSFGFLLFSKKDVLRMALFAFLENGFAEGLRTIKRMGLSYCSYRTSYTNYDFYHIHFVVQRNLSFVPFIGPDKKIILSFWGSDLLMNSDLINDVWVRLSLDRAFLITIQSVELKEVILAKFGRYLEKKIVVLQFILEDKIFREIDALLTSSMSPSQYTMRDKLNILIGHNARTENQHIKIIEELIQMPKETKDKIHLIFVFGYGLKDQDFRDYYKQHISVLLDAASIRFTIIDKFLDFTEIAKLRCSSEITVHLPVSDALSAAVTESFYAGSIVITGSWLPYGPFRRSGLKFLEVEKFEDLREIVPYIIGYYDQVKSTYTNDRDSIVKNFLNDDIGKKWGRIYDI